MAHLHGTEDLGALLRAWRTHHGLAQMDVVDGLADVLARRGTRIDQTWISRLERGRGIASPEVCEEVAALIGIGRDAGWRLGAGQAVDVDMPAWWDGG